MVVMHAEQQFYARFTSWSKCDSESIYIFFTFSARMICFRQRYARCKVCWRQKALSAPGMAKDAMVWLNNVL